MKTTSENKKQKPVPFVKNTQVFMDERGTFIPMLGLDDLNGKKIKRVYHIYNFGKGVVRGFHFHKREWKYFTIVQGAAKFIALDPKNPEKKYKFISSSRKPDLVISPPGYANGWVSLEEQTVLVFCSTSTIEESIKDDLRFDPYKWGDLWKQEAR
jgi:dTDP-4-dehydrorhamnose 3,5-epimerase